jgi:exopolysaccharide biosynthesis polyprenyl glycosylphosphotransferase
MTGVARPTVGLPQTQLDVALPSPGEETPANGRYAVPDDISRCSSSFEIAPERVVPTRLRFAPIRSDVTSPLRGLPTSLWRSADLLASTLLLVGVLLLTERESLPKNLDGLLHLLGPHRLLTSTLFLLAWAVLLTSLGLYQEQRLARGGDSIRIVAGCTLGSLLIALLPLASTGQNLGIVGALLFGSLSSLTIAGIREMGRVVVRSRPRAPVRNVVIVGGGPRATAIHRELTETHQKLYNVFGFVDSATGARHTTAEMRCLGSLEQLETILEQQIIDMVCIALPVKSHYESFQRAITICERTGVEFRYPIDTFEHVLTRPRLRQGLETINVTAPPVVYDENLILKRILDVVVASTMCVALAIPILMIALAIKVSSPGPVFFKQERYGRNKRLFEMYKFRSMRTDAEATLLNSPALYEQYAENNFKLAEGSDPRVTPLGHWLRKCSLDELPQLWNVLRGDMSLVGPRPIVPAELAKYGSAGSLLLALKPGMTGVWVVEGRSRISYPRRAELELNYVRNWSMWKDLGILLRTIEVVFRCDGPH